MMVVRVVKRWFGIGAPRVEVRPWVPWYWRWLLLTLAAILLSGIGWYIFDVGRRAAGYNHRQVAEVMDELNTQLQLLQRENEVLKRDMARGESQVQIERGARADLAQQVRALGEENGRLKEDLAFFQNLMIAGDKQGTVSIHRLRIQRDSLPGEYRYSLFLAQSGTRVKDFEGNLQVLIDLRQNGKTSVITLPKAGEDAGPLAVKFKFYQRVEGVFRVPAGAEVESIQVRVFQKGASDVKVSETATVS